MQKLQPGLYEQLVTAALEGRVDSLNAQELAQRTSLDKEEAADRSVEALYRGRAITDEKAHCLGRHPTA